MAGYYPLEINQGEDFSEAFQWCVTENKTPVNLTGYTGKCQIRSTPQSKGILATLVVTILDATNGIFELTLSATLAANIPTNGPTVLDVSRYVYDVEFTSSSGKVYRVLNGPAVISPEVTE